MYTSKLISNCCKCGGGGPILSPTPALPTPSVSKPIPTPSLSLPIITPSPSRQRINLISPTPTVSLSANTEPVTLKLFEDDSPELGPDIPLIIDNNTNGMRQDGIRLYFQPNKSIADDNNQIIPNSGWFVTYVPQDKIISNNSGILDLDLSDTLPTGDYIIKYDIVNNNSGIFNPNIETLSEVNTIQSIMSVTNSKINEIINITLQDFPSIPNIGHVGDALNECLNNSYTIPISKSIDGSAAVGKYSANFVKSYQIDNSGTPILDLFAFEINILQKDNQQVLNFSVSSTAYISGAQTILVGSLIVPINNNITQDIGAQYNTAVWNIGGWAAPAYYVESQAQNKQIKHQVCAIYRIGNTTTINTATQCNNTNKVNKISFAKTPKSSNNNSKCGWQSYTIPCDSVREEWVNIARGTGANYRVYRIKKIVCVPRTKAYYVKC